MDGSVPVVGRSATASQESAGSVVIKSVFIDGYWWVEIPDEIWEAATQMDYVDGYPIYVRR